MIMLSISLVDEFWAIISAESEISGVEVSASFFFGKLPLPFNNQYNSTSLNSYNTFNTKSKLGLFLPDSRCDILDLWTLILSAKEAADNW